MAPVHTTKERRKKGIKRGKKGKIVRVSVRKKK